MRISHWDAPSFAILSAERKELSGEENIERTKKLGALLAASPHDYEKVVGFYAGVVEASFLVLLYGDIDGTEWQDVIAYAAYFEQDSVLYVDELRNAGLYEIKTGALGLQGKWRGISAAQAHIVDGWTRDKHGRYWTIVSEA